ncbi:hypothetical protein [Kitasatospora sp. NPDC002965]|uniref:hypothetical protein n=1 Tax=Kitasatospora sp. NPDC002965 TaxID=3154775 RepID=UPI0033A44E0C
MLHHALNRVRPDLVGPDPKDWPLELETTAALYLDPHTRAVLEGYQPMITSQSEVVLALETRMNTAVDEIPVDLRLPVLSRIQDIINANALAAAQRRIRAQARLSAPRGWNLTRAAAWIAGPRHAHLRGAWLADLAGAPESGLALTDSRRLALAVGFVLAALRLRLRHLGRPLWAPVDWALSTSSRVRAAIAALVGAQAVYIDATGGLHELLTEGVQACAVTGAGLYALSRWLHRIRAVELASRQRGNQQEE